MCMSESRIDSLCRGGTGIPLALFFKSVGGFWSAILVPVHVKLVRFYNIFTVLCALGAVD